MKLAYLILFIAVCSIVKGFVGLIRRDNNWIFALIQIIVGIILFVMGICNCYSFGGVIALLVVIWAGLFLYKCRSKESTD